MMPNENQSHTILKQFKRLSTQTIIYGLGDAIIKAITFFLIPLYTRVLTQEEVGIIALINLIELILVLILSLSFNSAVLKVFFDYETEREKRAVFSTSLIFILLCALCFLTVVFFNTDVLSRLLFKTDKYAFYLKFVLGSVFFSLFRLFGLAYLRALEKPVHYSILNIIHFSLLVSLNIYHILLLKQSIFGIVKSSFFTAGFLFLLVALTVFRNIGFVFSTGILKRLLHFGLPMMPGVIAGWMLTVSDRYLLNWLVSPAEVGLYDIAYKFGMIIQIILVMPFRTAWLPFIFSIKNDKNADKIYANTLTYFLFVAIFIFLAVSLFAKEIVRLVSTPAYLPGANAIPLVALAYVCYGIFYIVDVGVLLKVKTYYYTVITGIGALVNIGLNILMIPKMGMMAAAVNTLIAYSLILILMFFVSQRLYPVRYEKARILKISFTGSSVFVLSLIFSFDSEIINIIFKSVLIFCYLATFYFLNFFRATEIAGVLQLFSLKKK